MKQRVLSADKKVVFKGSSNAAKIGAKSGLLGTTVHLPEGMTVEFASDGHNFSDLTALPPSSGRVPLLSKDPMEHFGIRENFFIVFESPADSRQEAAPKPAPHRHPVAPVVSTAPVTVAPVEPPPVVVESQGRFAAARKAFVAGDVAGAEAILTGKRISG